MSMEIVEVWTPAGLIALTLICGSLGCADPKEKVLDVEAPGFNLEVERSKSEADIHIDTPANKDGPTIRIETEKTKQPD